jgi:hypothetical protein
LRLVFTDTALTQETVESESAKVKFPQRIKRRGRVSATVYGKCKGRDSYRAAWQAAGRRHAGFFPPCPPAMIRGNDKGLATKAGAGKWFAVLPPDAAQNAVPLREVRP